MKAICYNPDSPSYNWFRTEDGEFTYHCKSIQQALTAKLHTNGDLDSMLRIFNLPTTLTYEYQSDPYIELPELFI